MRRLFACLLLLALTSSVATAQVAQGTPVVNLGISDGAIPPPPYSPPATLYPLIFCDQIARINNVGTSAAILIPHAFNKRTYICGVSLGIGAVASVSAQLLWGTGSTCGTATVSASPVLAQLLTPAGTLTYTFGGAFGAVDQSPVSGTSDYCISPTGAAAANGYILFAQV